ncbi:MAG: hypothetical protein ACKV0T_22650 [Planctomycetales bacterium]
MSARRFIAALVVILSSVDCLDTNGADRLHPAADPLCQPVANGDDKNRGASDDAFDRRELDRIYEAAAGDWRVLSRLGRLYADIDRAQATQVYQELLALTSPHKGAAPAAPNAKDFDREADDRGMLRRQSRFMRCWQTAVREAQGPMFRPQGPRFAINDPAAEDFAEARVAALLYLYRSSCRAHQTPQFEQQFHPDAPQFAGDGRLVHVWDWYWIRMMQGDGIGAFEAARELAREDALDGDWAYVSALYSRTIPGGSRMISPRPGSIDLRPALDNDDLDLALRAYRRIRAMAHHPAAGRFQDSAIRAVVAELVLANRAADLDRLAEELVRSEDRDERVPILLNNFAAAGQGDRFHLLFERWQAATKLHPSALPFPASHFMEQAWPCRLVLQMQHESTNAAIHSLSRFMDWHVNSESKRRAASRSLLQRATTPCVLVTPADWQIVEWNQPSPNGWYDRHALVVWRNLFHAFRRQHRLELLTAECDRQADQVPDSTRPYWLLGKAYVHWWNCHPEEALEGMNEALEASDGDDEIRLVMVRMLQAIGNLEQIIESVDQARGDHPETRTELEQLALEAALALGNQQRVRLAESRIRSASAEEQNAIQPPVAPPPRLPLPDDPVGPLLSVEDEKPEASLTKLERHMGNVAAEYYQLTLKSHEEQLDSDVEQIRNAAMIGVLQANPSSIGRYWPKLRNLLPNTATEQLLEFVTHDFELHETGSVHAVAAIIDSLMQHELTREHGRILFERAWDAYQTCRVSFLANLQSDQFWKTRDAFDAIQDVIIEPPALRLADPWHAATCWERNGPDGLSTLLELISQMPQPRLMLDRLARRLRDALVQTPQWHGGEALLAQVHARQGDFASARAILSRRLADRLSPMPVDALWITAFEFESHDELRDLAISMYGLAQDIGLHQGQEHLKGGPTDRLIRLHVAAGRHDAARDTIVAFLDRQRYEVYDLRSSLHHRLNDLREAVVRLCELGYPGDAALVIAEFLHDPTTRAARCKPEQHLADNMHQVLQTFAENRDEWRDAFIPGSIARRFSADSRSFQRVAPLLLVASVASSSEELPMISLLEILAEQARRSKPMQEELQTAIGKLRQDAPNDPHWQMAELIVAGVLDDSPRFRLLAEALAESMAAVPPKTGERPGVSQAVQTKPAHPSDDPATGVNLRQSSRPWQIGLWPAARRLMQEPADYPLGARLAKQALSAAQNWVEPQYSAAILQEWITLETQRGDQRPLQRLNELLRASPIPQPKAP